MSSHRQGSSPDPEEAGTSWGEELSDQHREILRQVALDSIRMGLEEGHSLPVSLETFPEVLRRPGAVFVTLNRRGRLRGCIGSFTPRRSLVDDVAANAFAAAFRDPRFAPLSQGEFEELELHISLLGPLEPFPVSGKDDLLARLEPGQDGLLLEEPPRRATFLPQVWESLPNPEDFLGELLLKAGLARDHWSSEMVFYRYRVEEF